MLSGRILLELREAVSSTSDNGPQRGQDGISKVSTMDFAPRDEKNRRRVNDDGLSFDAEGKDAVGADDNLTGILEDYSGDEVGTGLGSGILGYASGEDVESQLRTRSVPVPYISQASLT